MRTLTQHLNEKLIINRNYKNVDDIKSLFDNIRDGTRGKTYDYSFPKSRKITMTGGNPLGWIQLSFEEN